MDWFVRNYGHVNCPNWFYWFIGSILFYTLAMILPGQHWPWIFPTNWGIYIFFVLYSTLLHLPPLRFHWVDQGPLQLVHWQSDALTTRLDQIASYFFRWTRLWSRLTLHAFNSYEAVLRAPEWRDFYNDLTFTVNLTSSLYASLSRVVLHWLPSS